MKEVVYVKPPANQGVHTVIHAKNKHVIHEIHFRYRPEDQPQDTEASLAAHRKQLQRRRDAIQRWLEQHPAE